MEPGFGFICYNLSMYLVVFQVVVTDFVHRFWPHFGQVSVLLLFMEQQLYVSCVCGCLCPDDYPAGSWLGNEDVPDQRVRVPISQR